MAVMVTVYDKEHAAHKMTLANARDMVTHSGWGWKPGVKHIPTYSQPYTGALKVDTSKSGTEEVISKVKVADTTNGFSENVVQPEPVAPDFKFEEIDDSELPPPGEDEDNLTDDDVGGASDLDGSDLSSADAPRKGRGRPAKSK